MRITLREFLLTGIFSLLASVAMGNNPSIVVSESPVSAEAPVGGRLESFVEWHIVDDIQSGEEFQYSVSSDSDLIEIQNPSGSVQEGESVRNELSLSCEEAHEQIVLVSIQVAETEQDVDWSITCSGASISINPIESTVAHVEHLAEVTLDWEYTWIGEVENPTSYEISSTNPDVRITPSSGSAEADTQTVSHLAFECAEMGTLNLPITLRIGTVESGTTWHVRCLALPHRIVIREWPESLYEQQVGEYLQGHFAWSIEVLDDSEEAVLYRISSMSVGVFLTNTHGNVGESQAVRSSFALLCRDRGIFTHTLRIDAGGVKRDLSWKTKCIGEDLSVLTASIYQGPLIAQIRFREEDGGWSKETIQETYYKDRELQIDPTRTTFISLKSQHNELLPLPLSINVTIQGESSEIQPFEVTTHRIRSAHKSANFESHATFDLGTVSLDEIENLEISVDPENQFPEVREDNNEIAVDFSELEFSESPTMHFHFVPLKVNDQEPDLSDISVYLNPIIDFMPVGAYTWSVGESLDVSPLTWTIDSGSEVLERLFNLWLEEGSPTHFYHGIAPVPEEATLDNTLCGLATINGNTAITLAQSDLCSGYSTAHEFGHNLALKHAPSCGADAILPDLEFPYSDGSIGIEEGWLLSQRKYISPDSSATIKYADVMGYCHVSFVSQYSYGVAHSNLQVRLADSSSDELASRSKGLIKESALSWVVSGTVQNGRWEIGDLSLSNQTPVKLTTDLNTQYELRVIEVASGALLHKEPVQPLAIAHHLEERQVWGARIPANEQFPSLIQVIDSKGNTLLESPLRAIPQRKTSSSP